ncbi:MAG: VWA domain-containing protein [Enterobacterales bacterium]|nr:VWA domain-containing protein [Enterobacterales bacterium]
MLEEWVGEKWHQFITSHAENDYPEHSVNLEEVRTKASVLFRIFAGDPSYRVVGATDTDVRSRRTIAQRIAGTGKHIQYAQRVEETLKLPEMISFFPSRELNSDLYLWLIALSSVTTTEGNWITKNQQRTVKTLQRWPGLFEKYHALLGAHLLQRPEPDTLPVAEAAQERAIRSALLNPEIPVELKYAKKPPQPVYLWLHPAPGFEEIALARKGQDPDNPETSDNRDENKQQSKRKKATRTEVPEGKSGLLSFRLESLWSWTEFSKLDRTATEEDDDDIVQTFEDMDTISVGNDGKTIASSIKADLDLPANQYDDIVLGEGIPVDEWDYKQRLMQPGHCRIIPMRSREMNPIELPTKLTRQSHQIRRQFEVVRPQRHWIKRQKDGSELDLENYINLIADRVNGSAAAEMPVYREYFNKTRDLSCLLLADLSLSTDAHVNDHERVIDVIKDSLFLFGEALAVTGDRFAIHGFSSRNRNHVRFYDIKRFDEKYDSDSRGYIEASRPGYYTRMGTAIRHASDLLEKEQSSQKLLLILTDGKPNDLDKYEGIYGIEDTRQAIIEAAKKGLQPFCITIDDKAGDYLPYLFGKNAYIHVKKIKDLPIKLPQLYLKLT